jgi:transcription initiation factor IIE alpha subunit
MNPDKYNRSISLLCPTCGCSDFSYDEGVDETIQLMTCVSCEREFNKDELIKENSENIDEHLSEIKEEVTKDVADELRKSLKKAFSGNKNIRFK